MVGQWEAFSRLTGMHYNRCTLHYIQTHKSAYGESPEGVLYSNKWQWNDASMITALFKCQSESESALKNQKRERISVADGESHVAEAQNQGVNHSRNQSDSKSRVFLLHIAVWTYIFKSPGRAPDSRPEKRIRWSHVRTFKWQEVRISNNT